MKNTTHPKLRPKPSARIASELRGDFPSLPDLCGRLVPAGSPEGEVEVNGGDDDEPDADVVVVGLIMPKKDDAMEDIFGCAAACMPLHSPARDCLSGFPFSVHLRPQVAPLTVEALSKWRSGTYIVSRAKLGTQRYQGYQICGIRSGIRNI